MASWDLRIRQSYSTLGCYAPLLAYSIPFSFVLFFVLQICAGGNVRNDSALKQLEIQNLPLAVSFAPAVLSATLREAFDFQR